MLVYSECKHSEEHSGHTVVRAQTKSDDDDEDEELRSRMLKWAAYSTDTVIPILDEAVAGVEVSTNAINERTEALSAEITSLVDDLVSCLRTKEKKLLDNLDAVRWKHQLP